MSEERTDVTPQEAFKLVGHELRISLLRALGEADQNTGVLRREIEELELRSKTLMRSDSGRSLHSRSAGR